MFYILNIFIVECTSANYRNLYYNIATKLLVAVVISCVSAIALTLITFPSSSGLIQYIFAQITPASLGIDTGNTSSGINASNVDQLATLTPNAFKLTQSLTTDINAPVSGIAAHLIGIAINGVILYYLYRPNVKPFSANLNPQVDFKVKNKHRYL